MSKPYVAALISILAAACSSDPAPVDGGTDAAVLDAPTIDGGRDAGASDAGNDAYVLEDAGTDAREPDDAGNDAGNDASTCRTTLLEGGTDIALQGWTTVMQTPSTLTYGDTFVELATTTSAGARMGGQLLLVLADAVTPGTPFRLEVVMQVVSASPHNALDSGAAILGSFTTPVGNPVDRAEMIYLDAAAMGWSDDTASFATAITDGAYHTYVLAVDAAGTATVSIDGTTALTRTGYTTTGTIAIGDQTNDPNVDGTLRIRSVTLVCP